MQDPQLLESVRQQTASLPEAVALEVVDPETKAMRDALAKQALKTGFNWKRAGLISLAAVMSFGILGFSAFAIRANQKSDVTEAKATYAVSSVPLSGITSESVLGLAQIGQLDLNGIVKVNGALVLTPSTQPQDAQAGQIYFDKTSGSVLYYTGTEFREVSTTGNTVKSINGITGDIRLGPSLTFANGVLGANIPPQTAIAVTSVQGQTGDVLFTGGAGIALVGTTISNTGVTSLAGQTGNLTVGRGLTVAAGVLSSTSVISSGSANIIITDNGNGNYTIADSGVGGAGNVALGPVAPQTDNTANPSISIDKTGAGDLLNLLVNGSTTFRVNNTGLIVNGSIDYSQVTNRPASTVTSVGGASGAITVGTGLSLAANNLTNTGVTSLSGTPNQVTVSGATGNITLSLPQNIATTSSPTFAALTLSSALSVGNGGTGATTAGGARTNLGAAASGANSDITSLTGLSVINPGAALTIGNTGQALTLQGSATTSLTATSGAFTSALVFQSPSVNATITVPNATGTICLSTGNCLGGAGGGANTALSNLTSVSLNTSLLPGSSTIDLGSNSAPFQDLYIGGTATTNFKFTGVATTARTITVPDASGTLCLSTGNCAGAGSGITGSGTANKLAVFSAGQNIVDSIISQNAGATIATVTGDLSVTGTISGNGGGLTSLNGSNISTGTVADTRLSANVTLQGNTFNGNSQLVQINGSGQLPAVSGALLTTLNASNLSSGTVADARLTANVTLAGNAFNGANQLVQLTASGFMPALNGAALTSLNATNITSGIVAVGVGGTGITSYTTGDLIYASGTTTLAKLAAPAAGQCLVSNGVGVAPSWGSCLVGGGIGAVGTLDSQSKSADGAVISGSTIYFQTADASNVGLVSNGAQTFGGAKTFNSLLTGQAGLNVTGAAINLNASSNFGTNINTGTSTGAVNIGNSATQGINITTSASTPFTLTSYGSTLYTDSFGIFASMGGHNTLYAGCFGVCGGYFYGSIGSTSLGAFGSNISGIVDGGSVTFSTATNTTTGFRVQNASTTSIFNVDTTNSAVQVAGLLDNISATPLNIGTTNATQINLNKNTQLTGNLTFASGTTRNITIADQTSGNTNGNALVIRSGAGFGTGQGGYVNIVAADGGNNGAGGNIALIPGSAGGGGTANGGSLNLNGGASFNGIGQGGNVNITGGGNTTTGRGGTVNIVGGGSDLGQAGDIYIDPGQAGSAFNPGAIFIGTYAGGGTITIGNTSDSMGVNILNAGTINLGTGAVGSTINLGTGAGVKTITIGSSNTTSTTNIISGSGGINLTGTTKIANLTTAGIVTNTAAGVLGTVASIPVANGGTGLSSYTTGDLLYASGSGTIAKLAAVATGQCLVSQGVGVAPAYGSCAVGSTLQGAYTGSTGGTTSEIVLDGTRGAVDIQDRSTSNGGTLGANLFNIRASAANDTTAGSLLFGVGNTGSVLMQNSVDSISALQVLNAAGTNVFAVDTTNSRAIIRGTNSSAIIGAELFNQTPPNNNFNNATYWTLGSGWGSATATTVTATAASTSLTATSSNLTVVSGKTYQVVFTVGSYSGGSLQTQIGNVTGSSVSKNGTHTIVITAANSGALQFNATTFSGVLSNVSVKEVVLANSALAVQDSTGTNMLELRVTASNTNAFVGLKAGQANTSTGTGNSGFGSFALQSNTAGQINTAVGYGSLQNNTTGSANTAVGAIALQANTTGQNNSALGYGALKLSVTGTDNTALGFQALAANTTGDYNTATGSMTLYSNTTGSSNTAYGQRALFSNTTGSSNTGLGEGTLYNNTTGSKNVAVGTYAQIYGSNGYYNTSIGYLAGSYAENTNQFVSLANVSNTTAIGANAQVYASNVVALGGQNADKVKVGIGTGMPSNTLSVEPWRTATGTVTTDGSAVIVGAGFAPDMVGNIIYIATGTSTTAPYKRLITGYTSSTSITVDAGVPALTGAPYYINYPGLQVAEYGYVGIGTLSPTTMLDVRGDALVRSTVDSVAALQVQNTNSGNLLSVGTSSNQVNIGASSALTFDDTMIASTSGALTNNATHVAGNYVRLTDGGFFSNNGQVTYTDVSTTNYDANFQYYTTGGTDDVYWYGHATSAPSSPSSATGGYKIAFSQAVPSGNGTLNLYYDNTLVTSATGLTFNSGVWHDVRVVLSGTRIKVYYDSSLIFDYTDISRTLTGTKFGLGAGVGGYFTGSARVRNFTMSSSTGGVVGSVALNVYGSGKVQSVTNSTAAFQIQNASGVDVLSVDTTNSNLTVRSSAQYSYGTELITNGNFTTGAWTTTDTANWTLASTTATYNGLAGTLDTNQFTAVPGDYYSFSFTLSGSTNLSTIDVSVGGEWATIDYTGDGQYKGLVQANSATGLSILAYPWLNSTFSGTISNISVKHATPLTTTISPVFISNDVNGVANLEVRSSNETANLFIGLKAGAYNTSGIQNTAYGSWSLQSNTTGSTNTAFGASSLAANTIGSANTAVGNRALASNTTGISNNAFGSWSLQSNTSGSRNAAFGNDALTSNTIGSYNTAMGQQALASNISGNYNIAVGYSALLANNSGGDNIAVGAFSLFNNTAGAGNVALGSGALLANTTGNNNAALSASSLTANTTGSNNVAVGFNAGVSNVTGDNNTFVGTSAGYAGTNIGFRTSDAISNSAAFGSKAQVYADNSIAIGGQGSDAVRVGIGTGLPAGVLSVEPVIDATGFVSTTAGSGTVTGTATNFTSAMIGSRIYIASGLPSVAPYAGVITAVGSTTSITVSPVVPNTFAAVGYYVNYVGLQVGLDGNVGIGVLSPTARLQVAGINTTSALLVQNANGVSVLNVDTTNNELQVGSYNGGVNPIAGRLVVNNATNANSVGIVAGATASSYTLTLPTTAGSANDCLKNSGTAGVLTFGSCGASGGDLQSAYNAGSAGDQVIALTSANDSLIFRNPASSGTDSNQVLTVDQLNTGSLDALVVNNAGTGNILNLKDNGTTVLKVTDGGNITALGASTGTTGTTEATARTNVTTVTLTAAGSFANNDIIFINNAGQDYYTRIVSGGGTTTLTVSPEVSYDASATVTKYNLQNIGATSTDYTTQSNRFFQGYFLGGVVTGAGSTTLSDGSITSTNGLKLQTATGVSVQGTNSSTAFSVNNSAGTNILVVDSTASVIKAGAVTAPVVNNYTVNENFTTNAPTGTFYGVATYSAGNYLQLNSGNDNSGNIEYNPSLESDFTANFEFYTSGGADAVYFYAYNSSTPTVENQASGGYMVSFSEYGGYIALTYNGTTLANVSQSGMNNSTWRTVQIIKSGYNIKVYLDGALKIDYTDSLRLLPGTKMGLGARSGGTSGTHRVRNLDVDWSVTTPGTNPVLNINTTTGQTVFTSSTNSTSAFKIQNSSNQNVLNVDTQNAFVGINTSSASAALQVAPSGASSTFSDGFESGSLGTFSVTGQSYQWGITTATKHTGTYAVGVSNTLAYNEVTEIKTVKTIGANGGIISWWRYHNGATDLLLYIDGVQVFNDGNANQGSWVQNSYIVSAGTHTITWRVDFGQGGGRSASDAVYIDDISITNVTSSTASAIFEGGVGIGSTSVPTHTLDVNTSSSATSWLSVRNGSSLQGGLLFNEGQVYGIQAAAQNTNQTNGSLVFDYRNMFDGSVAQSKILTINGTGFVGIGTDAPTASLQITPTASTYIQDFESGSIAPFNALTSAPYDWTASNTIAHGGSYSAYANNSAGLNQLVEFDTTKTLSTSGTVTFWAYHVGGTPLKFYIDGSLVNNDNANYQGVWRKYSFNVASGTHTFKWQADFTARSASDKVYIDDISITNAGSAAALVVSGGNSGFGTSTPTATIDVRGTALFKSSVNSTTAFQIQTAGGTSFFTADSTNSIVTVTNLVVTASLTVNGHIISGNSSGTTTVAAGAAACTSPTVSVSGNDTAGVITVTTGTGCSAGGTLATVTFANAFASAPVVTLTPQDSASAGLQTYATQGTGTFVLGTNTTAANTTTYKFNYHTIQ